VSVRFSVACDDGASVEFECADTFVSRWVCGAILQGETYPSLPIVDDVEVVCDVGANCGAASVYFARHYPDAIIHAFEPASAPLAYLLRNAASYANIRVHAFGLHSRDHDAELFLGDGDSILGSIVRRDVNLDDHETVTLRHGGAWAVANNIDRIDLLKVDVELCEVDVLEGLADLLPTVKVLYIEYGTRVMRREIHARMIASHVLYAADLFLDQGECIYVRRDIANAAPPAPVRRRDDWSTFPPVPFAGDADPVHVRGDVPIEVPAGVAVVYVEAHAAAAFDRVDDALASTHQLYIGTVQPDGAFCTYLRNDLADLEAAQEHLRAVVRERWSDAATPL
jgi:FkbM family methyltransferase